MEWGVDVRSIYRRTYQAKLTFRGRIIESVVRRRLTRERAKEKLYNIVNGRCKAGHACFVYRFECSEVRDANKIVSAESDDERTVDLTAELSRFAEIVRDALDDWGLSSQLDRCEWT